MPISLSPNTGQPIKSESVAISVSCADLSTFCGAPNTAAVSGFLNDPQPISARARLRWAWLLHPTTQVFAFRIAMAENLRGLRKSHGAHGAPYESILRLLRFLRFNLRFRVFLLCVLCVVQVPSHSLRTSLCGHLLFGCGSAALGLCALFLSQSLFKFEE